MCFISTSHVNVNSSGLKDSGDLFQFVSFQKSAIEFLITLPREHWHEGEVQAKASLGNGEFDTPILVGLNKFTFAHISHGCLVRIGFHMFIILLYSMKTKIGIVKRLKNGCFVEFYLRIHI